MFKIIESEKSEWNHFSLGIKTPWENDCGNKNYNIFYIAFFKKYYRFKIPQIIKPKKIWVEYSKGETKGYYQYIPKDYGFSTFDDMIHIHYGIQPGTWMSYDKKNSDHTKSFFIPWKAMTYVGLNLYEFDPYRENHKLVKSFPDKSRDFEEIREFISNNDHLCHYFLFNDYDGEEIEARCYIQERVWNHGTSWCKWLKYFKKPLKRRVLEIQFSKEVGRRKGSWKGGTIAHSIEIEDGESPFYAFWRYGNSLEKVKYEGMKNRDFSNIRTLNVENEKK